MSVDHARALPAAIEIGEDRDHLKVEDGVIRCSECGSHVTIDPRTHTEYGHRRQSYKNRGEGRCSHRPGRLDENR